MRMTVATKASSGSTQMMATGASTALCAGHRQEKQPVVCLQFHAGRASGLYVWRTAQKQYRLILDSSDMKYGGPTEKRQVAYRAKEGECDGQPYRIAYALPAYGVAVFSF